MFDDRSQAGRRLGEALASRGIEADLVLGVPRGGVPVADAVARRLDAPLDVVVAEEVTLPHNQETAVGAVTADGNAWYHGETVEQIDIDESELRKQERLARERAVERRESFSDSRPPVEVAGTQVVVDDGITTTAMMRACVESLDDHGAAAVLVAVPVAAPSSVTDLLVVADEVIALKTPRRFRAIGRFYESFEPLSTADAVECLRESAATG